MNPVTEKLIRQVKDPQILALIERFGKIWAEHPKNIGLMIIIGADSFQQSMGEVFTRTFGGLTEIARYVRTIEEAGAILAERSQ